MRSIAGAEGRSVTSTPTLSHLFATCDSAAMRDDALEKHTLPTIVLPHPDACAAYNRLPAPALRRPPTITYTDTYVGTALALALHRRCTGACADSGGRRARWKG